MDERKFQTKYDGAMKGSLEDLITLSKIDPTDPHYNSQIGRVFDVLYHCMSRANPPRSLTPSREQFKAAAFFCLSLTNLSPSDVGEVPACLSRGFTRIWPVIWKVINATFVPSLTAQHTHIPAETRLLLKGQVSGLLRTLGHDERTLRKMISTPGVNSFTLKMWTMEVENPDYHPWDAEYCATITGFLDRVFIVLTGNKDGMDQFLAPMNGDIKYLVSVALRHHHHSFHRAQPNMDSLIWNTHMITVLSGSCDPIRNAFLAQHSVPAVTKALVAMTAETPDPDPASASLKAVAISYGFWNLMLMVQSTEGVTWVIQALEAKLLFALARCEVWVPYMTDDPTQFLYPFLDKLLPNYTAYRSVLCVMEKSLTKIQQLGLDARKSENVPLWKAWNVFVELAKSRLEVLQTAPGGLLQQAHGRCHNETCAQDQVRGEFQQCGGCLSAKYCSKICQTRDWKSGGHRQFCKELVALRYDGHVPEISKGDFDFISTMIEAERLRFEEVGAYPAIFRAVGKKLAILLFDFLVCPPTKAVMPPENFNFCEHHCDEPLRARWDRLRENMDTLDHPTLVFCVRVQRGQTSLPIFRVVTTTLKDEPNELVILKEAAGCTCSSH